MTPPMTATDRPDTPEKAPRFGPSSWAWRYGDDEPLPAETDWWAGFPAEMAGLPNPADSGRP